jgi:hypothetical protein
VSSVPAVLAALASLGVATLPNTQTINGGSGSVVISRERLFLVADEEILIQRDFDSLAGPATSSEQYFVPLAMAADLSGADQLAADSAAFADYEAMVQAILDHPLGPTIGIVDASVLAISVQPTGEHRFVRLADENGRHSLVRWGVQVYAQLS